MTAQVSLASPADGSVVQGKVLVKAEVVSSTSVQKVGFSVDGRLVVTDYRAPYKFSWNTRFVPPGTRHVVTAVAYDGTGGEVGRASESLLVAEDRVAAASSPATLPEGDVFIDVASDAIYGDAVFNLAESGVVDGFVDGSFKSEQTITRAQSAKMISGALGIVDDDSSLSTPFIDLGSADGDMYPHKYIASLYSIGAIEGTSPGFFSPWDEVTRAQAISMLVRAIQSLSPNSLAEPPEGWAGIIGSVDPNHDESIALAEYNGLFASIQDYGSSWDPWAPASRGEVAQLLYNLTLLK